MTDTQKIQDEAEEEAGLEFNPEHDEDETNNIFLENNKEINEDLVESLAYRN